MRWIKMTHMGANNLKIRFTGRSFASVNENDCNDMVDEIPQDDSHDVMRTNEKKK